MATDEGVFRYDGYELLPLARLVRPGSCPAPRGQVFSLCLDAGGHLWVGADAGLFCLTLRTGAFRRVPLPQEAPGESAAVGLLFYHPRSGHLWVSYRDVSLVVLDARRGGGSSAPPASCLGWPSSTSPTAPRRGSGCRSCSTTIGTPPPGASG